MGLITALICFGCAALGYIIIKNKLSPQLLFCGFMGIIVSLASLRLYGLAETSFLVYLIVIIGTFSFLVGSIVTTRRVVVVQPGKASNSRWKEELSVNQRLIIIIAGFLLIWSFYRLFSTVIPLLRRGYPLDMIRMIYFGSEFQGYSYSRFDDIIEMFVNLPFLYALIPVVSIELTCRKENRKLNKSTILLLILWIVLSCVISGGRVLIYNFAVVLISAFIINNKNYFSNRLKTRTKILIIIIVALLIYAMYQLSINRRSTGDVDFLYQIYIYFCGCLPHTSLRLDTVNIDYTYGVTFLSGILRPIMLVYKYTIGHGQFPALYQKSLDIGVTLQSAVSITEGHTFNAFVVPFYYFYYDGGIVAVFIESFLYGLFCGNAFSRYRVYPTKRNLAKYLVVIIYIAGSMIRFSPSLVYFAFAYFYVDFLYFRQRAEGE